MKRYFNIRFFYYEDFFEDLFVRDDGIDSGVLTRAIVDEFNEYKKRYIAGIDSYGKYRAVNLTQVLYFLVTEISENEYENITRNSN